MTTPNPLEKTYALPPPPISTVTHHIAGIRTTIQGLSELPPSCDTLSILWLLHPRNLTQESMLPHGANVIHAWNAHRPSSSRTGLIAVSFDQRNHGTRLIDQLANEAWRHGNKRHAQDMFGTIHGTATDVQILMDHLGSYLFDGKKMERGHAQVRERHFAMGISLGGHVVWQLLFNEPRIEGGISIIGCPDYMRLMSDRARLSKLETHLSSNGKSFLGSEDFPAALVASCQRYDPKGELFGLSEVINTNPSPSEQSRLRELLDPRIKGKSILVCSGGIDKLVPYRCSEPFLDFLKEATGKGGWYADGGVYVEDNVYDGIGHETSPEMVQDSMRFLFDLLEGKELASQSKSSKM